MCLFEIILLPKITGWGSRTHEATLLFKAEMISVIFIYFSIQQILMLTHYEPGTLPVIVNTAGNQVSKVPVSQSLPPSGNLWTINKMELW